MASSYGFKIEQTEDTCPTCSEANVSALIKVTLADSTETDTGIRMCHSCGGVWQT